MLHRKLVAVARHQDYRDDLVQRAGTQERVLKQVVGLWLWVVRQVLTTKD